MLCDGRSIEETLKNVEHDNVIKTKYLKSHQKVRLVCWLEICGDMKEEVEEAVYTLKKHHRRRDE